MYNKGQKEACSTWFTTYKTEEKKELLFFFTIVNSASGSCPQTQNCNVDLEVCVKGLCEGYQGQLFQSNELFPTWKLHQHLPSNSNSSHWCDSSLLLSVSERLTGIFWGKVSSCHVFNRAEIRNFQKLKEDADLVEMTWICFMCLKWGCSVHAPWTWFLSDCLDSNPVCFQPQRLVGSPEWSKRRVPVLSWKPHVVGFIQSQEDIWWGGGSGGCRIATAPYRPKDGSVRRWAGPPTSPPEPSPRTYIWT